MSDPVPPPSPAAPTTWRDRLELIAAPAGAPPSPMALAAAGIGLAVLAGVVWLMFRQPAGPPPEDVIPLAKPPAITSTTAAAVVVIDAAGAVRSPGVYRLPTGSRVADLLAAAGGLGPGADLERLNRAALLVDGTQVYVPRAGQPVPAVPGSSTTPGGAPSGPVDLNAATLEQLEGLPGVGPATAKAILDERARRGRFRSVEDLLDVRGIGPAKLEGMRDLVTV